MPFRDSHYEYVRPRQRKDKEKEKDKDKDKDKDNRSVASSLTIRRHREPGSARTTTTETASQILDDNGAATLDQLPPLPESADTSPILRTSSNVSISLRTSPSQVQTPASLQPYLEPDVGEDENAIGVTQTTVESMISGELIGPVQETSADCDDSTEVSTPRASKPPPSNQSRRESIHGPPPKLRQRLNSISRTPARPKSNPSPSAQAFFRNSLPPEEMENPFLAGSVAMEHHTRNRTPASQTASLLPDESTPSLPQIEQRPESPQHVDVSTVPVTAHNRDEAPKSITTYIGPAPPENFGYPGAVGSSPFYENPFLVLQRVTNAVPHINLLVQQSQEALQTLTMKDNEIYNLRTQQREKDARVGWLAGELESLFKQHGIEKSNWSTRLRRLEDEREKLLNQISTEIVQRQEAQAACKKLMREKDEMKRRYSDEVAALRSTHTQEKESLFAEHSRVQQAISEQATNRAQSADSSFQSRVEEMSKAHGSEKQGLERRWSQERRETDENFTEVRQHLEQALESQTKSLDEERREHAKMKQVRDLERQNLDSRLEEDRTQYRKDLEERSKSLTRKYHREKVQAIESLETTHVDQLKKSQDRLKELERSLETQTQQASEAQSLNQRLNKDVEYERRVLRQTRDDLRGLEKENVELRRMLENNETRSRALSLERQPRKSGAIDTSAKHHELTNSHELFKPLSEPETERRRNQEQQEPPNRIRRDPDSTRTSLADKRASLRGPMDYRLGMKASSGESSTGQKASDAATSVSKQRNVNWQE